MLRLLSYQFFLRIQPIIARKCQYYIFVNSCVPKSYRGDIFRTNVVSVKVDSNISNSTADSMQFVVPLE